MARFCRRSLAYNRNLMILTYINKSGRGPFFKCDKFNHENFTEEVGKEDKKKEGCENLPKEDIKDFGKSNSEINICINNYYDKEVVNYYKDFLYKQKEESRKDKE